MLVVRLTVEYETVIIDERFLQVTLVFRADLATSYLVWLNKISVNIKLNVIYIGCMA